MGAKQSSAESGKTEKSGKTGKSRLFSPRRRKTPTSLVLSTSSTSVNEEEVAIDYLRRSFLRHHSSGTITCSQLQEDLKRKFPDAEDTSEFASHLFRAVRNSRPGRHGKEEMSVEDFAAVVSSALHGDDWNKLSWVFGLYDVDGDGYITRQEMLDVVRSVERLSPSPVTGSPLSAGDSHIRPRCNSVEARVKKVFADLDEDGDGKVTRTQFLEVAKNDLDLFSFQAPDVALIATSGYASQDDHDEIDGSCGSAVQSWGKQTPTLCLDLHVE